MKLRLIVSLAFLSLPSILFAQGNVYSPLVDLSNAGQGNQVQTFEQYINFLYGMSIAVAALLAVIKIVIAGAKYMMSDVIGNKEGAKTDIQGAVLGLLLILSAVIILELINPQLTEKNITFPELQSPRGSLSSLAVTTANGQTIEQHASSLAEGLDTCVFRTNPGTSVDGKLTIVVANANPCGERGRDQLIIFSQNCIDEGGKPRASAPGSGMVVCETPIDGGENVAAYTSTLTANPVIPSSFSQLGSIEYGSQYTTTNGNIVSVNTVGVCENWISSLENGSMKSQAYASCLNSTRRNLEYTCAGDAGNGPVRRGYGSYGTFNGENISAISCTLPKEVRSMTSFGPEFEEYKRTHPELRFDSLDSISLSNEIALCRSWNNGTHFDEWGSENTCVRY